MPDWWCADDKTDEDAGNGATAHELIPEDHVMETIPLLGLDTCNDTILLPVLGDRLATSDWNKKTILRALVINGIRNLAGLLPFLAVA